MGAQDQRHCPLNQSYSLKAMSPLYNLVPEAVDLVDMPSKSAILANLSGLFSQVCGLEREDVHAGLQAREAVGSTGFGRGVALPHARISGLKRPAAAFLRLSSPVEFDAADGAPVDLVFGLLSPENAGVSHLHALAEISRTMRDEDTRRMLADAPDREALFSLLANVVDRDAA